MHGVQSALAGQALFETAGNWEDGGQPAFSIREGKARRLCLPVLCIASVRVVRHHVVCDSASCVGSLL